MPNQLRVQGTRGTVLVDGKPMVDLTKWSIELIEQGRYSFVAEESAPDVTRWPFRDRNAPVRVELPMKRSTLTFRVMLSSEDPIAGEATLDTNTVEEGDFW